MYSEVILVFLLCSGIAGLLKDHSEHQSGINGPVTSSYHPQHTIPSNCVSLQSYRTNRQALTFISLTNPCATFVTSVFRPGYFLSPQEGDEAGVSRFLTSSLCQLLCCLSWLSCTLTELSEISKSTFVVKLPCCISTTVTLTTS